MANINIPKPNESKTIFVSRTTQNLMHNGKSKVEASNTANHIWNNYAIQETNPNFSTLKSPTNISKSPAFQVPDINQNITSSNVPALRNTVPARNALNNTPTQTSPSPTPSLSPSLTPNPTGPMPEHRLPIDAKGHGEQEYANKEFSRYKEVQQRYRTLASNPISSKINMLNMPYLLLGDKLPWHKLYRGGFEKGYLKNKLLNKYDSTFDKLKLPRFGMTSGTVTKNAPTKDALEAQDILKKDISTFDFKTKRDLIKKSTEVDPNTGRLTEAAENAKKDLAADISFFNVIKRRNLKKRAAATESVTEKDPSKQIWGDSELYRTGKSITSKVGTGVELGSSILSPALQAYPAFAATIASGRRTDEQMHFKRNAKDYGVAGKLHRGANSLNIMRSGITAPIAAALPFGLTGGKGFGGLVKAGAESLGYSGGAASMGVMGAMFLPMIMSMFTKHFAMKHKMKVRGARLAGDNKKFDNLPGIDSTLMAMTQGANAVSPYESMSLTLMRAIQLNTGSLSDTNEILHHYMENAANKDTPAAQENYSDYIDNSKDRKFKGIKHFVGSAFERIEGSILKTSQKYNPLHQLGTFLLTGKTPKMERKEIEEEFGQNKTAKERDNWIRTEMKRTGLTHTALTLMTTPGSQIASYAESPQGKMTNLLTGIFDILRYNLRVNTNIAVQGFGITNMSDVPKSKSKDGGGLIPGLNAVANIGKGLFKIGLSLFKTYKFFKEFPERVSSGIVKLGVKGFGVVKNLISGPMSKYSRDPSELVQKALGSKGASSGEVKEKVLTNILPNKLGEITGLQKHQLDALYNIWDVNKDILKSLSGIDKPYTNKVDTTTEIMDKFTGEMVSSQEMKKRVKEREKKIKDTLNKDLHVDIFYSTISKMMKRRKAGSLSDKLYKKAYQADRKLSKIRLGAMRSLDDVETKYVGGRENLNEYELTKAATATTVDPEKTNFKLNQYKKKTSHLRDRLLKDNLADPSYNGTFGERKRTSVREGYHTYKFPHLDADNLYTIPNELKTPTFSNSGNIINKPMRVEIAGITQDFHAYKCLPIEMCEKSKEPVKFTGSLKPTNPDVKTTSLASLPVSPEERDKYTGRGKTDTIGHELAQIKNKRQTVKDDQYKDKQISLLTRIADNKSNLAVPNNQQNQSNGFESILSFLGGLVGLLPSFLKFGLALGTIGSGLALANSSLGDFIKSTITYARGLAGQAAAMGDDVVNTGKGLYNKAKSGLTALFSSGGASPSTIGTGIESAASTTAEAATATVNVVDAGAVVTKSTSMLGRLADSASTSRLGQGIIKGWEKSVEIGRKIADTSSKTYTWAKNKVSSVSDFMRACKDTLGKKIEAVLTPLKTILESIKKSKIITEVLDKFRKIGDILFKVFNWIEGLTIGGFNIGKWFCRAFFIAPVIKDAWDLWKTLDDPKTSSIIICLDALTLIGSLAAIPAVATALGGATFGILPVILFGTGMLAEYWSNKLKTDGNLTEEEKQEQAKNKELIERSKAEYEKYLQDHKDEMAGKTEQSYNPSDYYLDPTNPKPIPSPQGPPVNVTHQYTEENLKQNQQTNSPSKTPAMDTNILTQVVGEVLDQTAEKPKQDAGGSPSPGDSGQSSLRVSNKNNKNDESILSELLYNIKENLRFTSMLYSSTYKIQIIKEWEQSRLMRQDQLESDKEFLQKSAEASGAGGGGFMNTLKQMFGGGSGGASSGSSGGSSGGGFFNAIKDAGKSIGRKMGMVAPTVIDPNNLGGLSEVSESGNNSGVIGFDNAGGASYGKYQIATKTGTMKNFLKYVSEQNPEVYDALSKHSDSMGDKEGGFAKTRKELAESGKIQDLEKGFIKKTHYDAAYSKLDSDVAKMVDGDKTLQQMMWSMSTAFGPSGGANHFNKYYAEMAKSGTVDKRKFIESLYDNAMTRYSPEKNADAWTGLTNRWTNKEKNTALSSYDSQQEAAKSSSTNMSSDMAPSGGTGMENEPSATASAGTAGFVFPGNNQTITSPMGPRDIDHGSKNHKGVDIRGSAGDPVRSMLDGEVVSSKEGWLVIKQSDGTTAKYAHMPDANLKPGDKVKAGQQLSVVGAVGTKTPHIHLEVHDDKGPMNPDDYFKRNMGSSYTPKYAFNDSESRNKLASQIGGRNFETPAPNSPTPNSPTPTSPTPPPTEVASNTASQMAGKIPNMEPQPKPQVTAGPQKDSISGSPESVASNSNFSLLTETITNAINNLSNNMTSNLNDMNTNFGRLNDLKSDYRSLSSVQKLKEQEDVKQEKEKEKQGPIIVPTPGPTILANPNNDHKSNAHVQERMIDPVSQNIIEQLFANTIISFQQSVKSFALGQSPFTAFR